MALPGLTYLSLGMPEGAVVERYVRWYRLLQGVVALTRRHPRERVEAERGAFAGHASMT